MSSIPEDLYYTQEHEWVKILDDGIAVIGVTDYAQTSLGDVTFVELPEVESEWAATDIFGVVESVKAASDLYMPVGGTVIAVNEALVTQPDLVNRDPYGEAWMIKVKMAKPLTEYSLLSAAEYQDFVG